MGRVINPDSTGKKRNQNMRACAELLRHLTAKQEMDTEAKDMLAAMVFMMREIDAGIDQSATVWEDRNYWNKAEELRRDWTWVGMRANELEGIIRAEAWDKIPAVLVGMLPRFADITITKFTRQSDLWDGQYQKLLAERS